MHKQVSAVIGAFFFSWLLLSCRLQTAPHSTAAPTLVSDRWQVIVATTGDVDLRRTIILDAALSPYIRGSARLDGASLLGELPTTMRNVCALIALEQQVTYDCRMTYTIEAQPTRGTASLTLPDDRLLRLLTDLLGYQPVPILLQREISVSVPGHLLPVNVNAAEYLPIYSHMTTTGKQIRESQLILSSEINLAPGDLPNPRLQQLPIIRFEPNFGLLK